jgi:alpha 1,2-mannosyltransferase
MEDTNKTYGFTIALYEYRRTIETLWPTVQEFTKLYPEFVAPNNAMGFLSDNGGQEYNLCHFWSNFEIADMDFWRGEAYTKFFEFLDSKGGFYYERWGDAPVHSIAAALFLPKERIHFFDEVGYEHNPYSHCPRGDKAWERGKCSCDQKKSFGECFPSSCVSWASYAYDYGRLRRLLVYEEVGCLSGKELNRSANGSVFLM